MAQDVIRAGGCRCGAVRYTVSGPPLKTGICHCTDCRRETGSAFLFYADWPRLAFAATGVWHTYAGRSFCAECGTRLFHVGEQSVEICLGSLDAAPTGLGPAVEGWIGRREAWLAPVTGAAQHRADPP